MACVDGFVLAVPKQQIEAYKEFARKAGEVWKEYGALAIVECIGDDLPYGELTSGSNATCQTCRSTAAHDLRRIRDVAAAIAMPAVC
jgi:uncharacterized protein YbaA (DUF1428 family)